MDKSNVILFVSFLIACKVKCIHMFLSSPDFLVLLSEIILLKKYWLNKIILYIIFQQVKLHFKDGAKDENIF